VGSKEIHPQDQDDLCDRGERKQRTGEEKKWVDGSPGPVRPLGRMIVWRGWHKFL